MKHDLPVCVLVCRFKSNVSLKPLPQNVHRYRLTSLWHFICLFSRRCRLNVFEHRLQQNLEPFLVDSTGSAGVFIDTTVLVGTTAVVVLSGSGALMRLVGGGNWSWLASGFLIPWPPLTNSNGKSLGRPSCKQQNDQISAYSGSRPRSRERNATTEKRTICTFAVSLLAKEEHLGFSRSGVVFLTLCWSTLTSKAELLVSLLFCGGGVSDDMVPSMLILAGDGADMLVLESISSEDKPGDNIICPQAWDTKSNIIFETFIDIISMKTVGGKNISGGLTSTFCGCCNCTCICNCCNCWLDSSKLPCDNRSLDIS